MKKNEKGNICRPITFYSNFLPVDKKVHMWRYCAFGIIDGVEVGERICDTQLDKKVLPVSIWKMQSKFYQEMPEGNYRAQRVYGVRYDNLEKEEAFWENKLPFIFFSRIQCNGEKEKLWEERETLESELGYGDRVKAMIYLTYDNSDLLLVLKADTYEDGAGIINALHRKINILRAPLLKANLLRGEEGKCYIKSSFTVFAVEHEWLDQSNNESREKFRDKLIECVDISVIERENGDIRKIVQELYNRKEHFSNRDKVMITWQPVLGIDDDVISIRNISWYDFLDLYKRKENVGSLQRRR